MLLKFGIVKSFDPATGYAVVEFREDGIVSGKLQVLQSGTNGVKELTYLKEGTQVACLLDGYCEEGVVLGAVYDDGNKPTPPSEAIAGATKAIKIGSAEVVIQGTSDDNSSIVLKRGSSVVELTKDAIVVDYGGAGVVTIDDSELKIEGPKVTITNDTGTVSIGSDGRIGVSVGGESLKKILTDILTQISALTVVVAGVTSGPPSNAVAFTAINARVPALLSD